MALGVLLVILLIGIGFAVEDGDLILIFPTLILAVLMSLATGAIAEIIDGVDLTETEVVEQVECIETSEGLVIYANDQLFEPGSYEYSTGRQQVVTKIEDGDPGLSWPWSFIESKSVRLEFNGCPD